MSKTEQIEATRESFGIWAEDHPNFVTPNPIEVEVAGPYAVEFSWGTSPFREKGNQVYGVTIARRERSEGRFAYETSNHDLAHLNECFEDREAARRYFENVAVPAANGELD